jgi:hypothetical protein
LTVRIISVMGERHAQAAIDLESIALLEKQ